MGAGKPSSTLSTLPDRYLVYLSVWGCLWSSAGHIVCLCCGCAALCCTAALLVRFQEAVIAFQHHAKELTSADATAVFLLKETESACCCGVRRLVLLCMCCIWCCVHHCDSDHCCQLHVTEARVPQLQITQMYSKYFTPAKQHVIGYTETK
jgi:hypothetical protein